LGQSKKSGIPPAPSGPSNPNSNSNLPQFYRGHSIASNSGRARRDGSVTPSTLQNTSSMVSISNKGNGNGNTQRPIRPVSAGKRTGTGSSSSSGSDRLDSLSAAGRKSTNTTGSVGNNGNNKSTANTTNSGSILMSNNRYVQVKDTNRHTMSAVSHDTDKDAKLSVTTHVLSKKHAQSNSNLILGGKLGAQVAESTKSVSSIVNGSGSGISSGSGSGNKHSDSNGKTASRVSRNSTPTSNNTNTNTNANTNANSTRESRESRDSRVHANNLVSVLPIAAPGSGPGAGTTTGYINSGNGNGNGKSIPSIRASSTSPVPTSSNVEDGPGSGFVGNKSFGSIYGSLGNKFKRSERQTDSQENQFREEVAMHSSKQHALLTSMLVGKDTSGGTSGSTNGSGTDSATASPGLPLLRHSHKDTQPKVLI